jgi:nucleotide-binding universal stress UspA family protein
VIPAGWDLERHHVGEVVVATDPADPHGAALGPVALAADVAARWGAPLLAAAVLPREPGHRGGARGRRMLDGILAGVPACGDVPFVDRVVGHGDAAEELLDLVGPPTGLLVLGAHGAASSSDPAPGPVCRRVVREARCPVAVVPPGVPGVRPGERRPAAAGSTR